jgi:hypothetical protein
MIFESDKTMFEIYREGDFNKKFRVVYFTELDEHNKESEINHALLGDPVFSGFLKDESKAEGRLIIDEIIRQMNEKGEAYSEEEIKGRLGSFLAN